MFNHSALKPNMTTELGVLKRRVAGFRTAFNKKINSASQLAKGVLDPPINRAPVVITQLQAYLAEIATSYNQLQQVLQSIIDLVIQEEDEKPVNHYMEYLAAVTDSYEDARAELVMALAEVEKQPVVVVAREDDSEHSDDEGSIASGSRRSRSPPPKSCTDLKPDKLQKHFKPIQFAAWRRKLTVWFEASRFAKLHVSCQQEYLRSCVADGLMALIEPDIASTTPIFPN